MKQKILMVSLSSALLASVFGIVAVLHQGSISTGEEALSTLVTTARLYQLAGISGLFGIASFFVGLAYPASVTETHVIGDGGATSTRNVVNN